MIDGRQRDEWGHTAVKLWQLYDCTRGIRQFLSGAKLPVKTPPDFNPFEIKQTPAVKPSGAGDQIAAMAPKFTRPPRRL
jgi:hypothetical protein